MQRNTLPKHVPLEEQTQSGGQVPWVVPSVGEPSSFSQPNIKYIGLEALAYVTPS